MIASGTISEIRCLLEEGTLSQRSIAARLGVSRGTVSAVALGKRPDYEARRRLRGEDLIPPRGVPRRCPECGRRVQMPCLACYLQSARQRGR
jgi:transcriptional regulator with XRE-family HTH domain